MPDDHQTTFGWIWFAAALGAGFLFYGTGDPHGGKFVAELTVSVAIGYAVAWLVVGMVFGRGPGIGPPGKPD